ncbi:MAG: site-specific integrase [Planctomycetes bacterium]|nr:site-specific integrase [Planctomycetota bacterium]
MAKQLVRLWERPSLDGKRFRYYLLYTDEQRKRRQKSLGHADKRKADRQRAQFERKLVMDAVEPGSMKLRDFVEDSLTRTGDQIRESTRMGYKSAMEDFIRVVGNIDYQRISLRDAELYRQSCLDKGNSPATVKKKLTEIKCIFGTAVKRKQLEENPLKYIKMPKCPENEINIYSDAECERIVKAALELTEKSNEQTRLRWNLLIVVALSTGMRRGELLNCTWKNIDFEEQTINVSPKANTTETWEWLIKDNDRRTLPLTDMLTQFLVAHLSKQPEGHPYVFVPPARYDYIQHELRANGKWTYSDSRLKLVSNFNPDFHKILRMAGIKEGEFHDLRRTAIGNWFKEGMKEFDVMRLAGHADFKTTHRYYLRVQDDLVDRARQATARGLCQNLLQKCCNSDFQLQYQKSCQT